MKASLAEIQSSYRRVEWQLRELDLLLDHNEFAVERLDRHTRRVTWATTSLRPDLLRFSDSTVEEYLEFIRGRHFNFLLKDASVIQLSYDLKRGDEIVGCRAVWFPCPVAFSVEDLEFTTIEELVGTTPNRDIGCRGPLRVDFAPGMAKPDHPHTHLHTGLENFRLPVQRAIEPTRFARLVLRTAYPHVWRGGAEGMTCDDWSGADNLTEEDRQVGFLGWTLGPTA